MTAARAKAPTLAWLLTALTCLLAGMAIVESRHQAVALPALPVVAPVGGVEAGAVAGQPSGSPEPMPDPGEAVTPSPTLLFEDAPVGLSAGPALLRVTRLTLPLGIRLSSEAAPGPTVLLVEAGTLSLRVESAVIRGPGLDATYPESVLSPGQRLVIAPGAGYAVRNGGPTTAVALAVEIVPGVLPEPTLGPEIPYPPPPTP